MRFKQAILVMFILGVTIAAFGQADQASNDSQTDPPAGMVYVPGGTFLMGDTRGAGDSDELPVHKVTLSPFYIGKYEVTQAEYAQNLQPK